MSASSLCVTCGMLSHDRCRNGPDTFLMRGSACVSTGPNFEKSCAGISGIPEPCGAAGAAAAAGCCDGPLRKPSRSSLVIRPFGPLAVTAARSTPSSRAIRRTLGPAWAPAGAEPPSPPVTAGGAARGAPTFAATGFACSGPGGASCCSTRDGGVVLAPSPELSMRIGVPSLTRSPTLTSTSPTVPADGAGTSNVALSDSSVSSGSSALTLSPVATSTSTMGTSVKSPMSGTLTSVAPAVAVDMELPLRPVENVRADRCAESGAGRVELVRVNVVAGDRVRDRARGDHTVGGQRGERRDDHVLAVDLEVPTQRLAVVRAAETVGTQDDVAAVRGYRRADLLGERAHVVRRRDDGTGRALRQLLGDPGGAGGVARVQQVPPVHGHGVAAQLGEARATPDVRGDAVLARQQVRRRLD